MSDYLCDGTAALENVARIRRHRVLHLHGAVGIKIDHQRVERVLLVEPLRLVWIREALLVLNLWRIKVLAWLHGESCLLLLVNSASNITLPSILRPRMTF